jgi:hypothetical protein
MDGKVRVPKDNCNHGYENLVSKYREWQMTDDPKLHSLLFLLVLLACAERVYDNPKESLHAGARLVTVPRR